MRKMSTRESYKLNRSQVARVVGSTIPIHGLSPLPKVCADQTLYYTCTFLFRPCTSSSNLPRAPCQPVCSALTPGTQNCINAKNTLHKR